MNDDDQDRTQRAAVRAPTGHHFARNLDWKLFRTLHDLVKANTIIQTVDEVGTAGDQ